MLIITSSNNLGYDLRYTDVATQLGPIGPLVSYLIKQMLSIPRLKVNKITSASGEYTHMVVFLLKILYFFVYRRKSMILCSPSPGTQQSEQNIFKFFQLCSISFNILSFKLEQRSYKNFVPGEIEFCWKYSSS